MAEFDYDFFVIGGGSGGVRAARVAASLGLKVAVAEEFRYGGTCVIRGCVPKKLYVYASHFREVFEDAAAYGHTISDARFDWSTLVSAKEAEITRLEGLYRKGLENNQAEVIDTRAVLTGPNTVRLLSDGREVSAQKILIAVGGHPSMPSNLPGIEHCITSNEAFDLPQLPKSILIAGGGYIALEFACIFNGLGVDTTVIYRGDTVLKNFDEDMREGVAAEMKAHGVKFIYNTVISSVKRTESDGLSVDLADGSHIDADQVMMAIGRVPNTGGLGLETAGVKMNEQGAVIVDDYSRTNVPSILAVGDVTNRVQLTPVAIHESMCLIETEFKNNPTKPDYHMIPTAVFTQPEIGTVGMAEHEAAQHHPALSVYRARFRPMKYTLPKRESYQVMKLIVDEATDQVVGAHILGPEAGEMAQLLGVILKGGGTKADFDATMALHPSAAEELVTMYQPSYRIVDGTRQD